jgi:HEAT repeat protein
MTFRIRSFCGYRLPARPRAWIACLVLSSLVGPLSLLPALADGCFVFRWNKNIDINEPTQKAIIVHDAGREDLLLQVKYEGPLEQFGWLIPVPSLPTVTKGPMRPFYELSELTQRQWGAYYGGAAFGGGTRGLQQDALSVIETKTVGAYQIAILSAQDAGSLERWLMAHGYCIPPGKAGIVEEYVRKGWYFVAAKIALRKPGAFAGAPLTAPKDAGAPARLRKAIQKQLSTGELHPLLISFDTPHCIYPLSISAVGGKPSEVSLYVLSASPLLDRFTFDKRLEKIHQRLAEQERTRPRSEERFPQIMRNQQMLRAASSVYSLAPPEKPMPGQFGNSSQEAIEAIAKEEPFDTAREWVGWRSCATSDELLHCEQVKVYQIAYCANELPRLKGRSWYLTKDVWLFRPEEMRDLEFQPAIPVLAATLSDPAGDAAAGVLSGLGPVGGLVLEACCETTNGMQRINASWGLQALRYSALSETLVPLLKDDLPAVRLNASVAAAQNWDNRLLEPLAALLHDRYLPICRQAASTLQLRETTNRAAVYLALLKDPDPVVQGYALQVLSGTNRAAIPRSELLRLLGSPRLSTVNGALNLLQGREAMGWHYGPSMSDPHVPTPGETNYVSSAEAAPLTTNRLTLVRLMGLKILYQTADAQAVALTLPLLRDTNSIVRNRACALLRTVSGQAIPQNDPAKWEQWWAANKDTFVAQKPPQ